MIDSLSRKEVEDLLVDELLTYLTTEDSERDYAGNNYIVLRAYLRKGFKGFENEPVDELQDEYRRVFGSDIEITN